MTSASGDFSTFSNDFSSIKSVFISFSNELLNASASDSAHNFDDFFEANGDTLKSNLLSIISAQVQKILQLCEGDSARIPSIMSNFFYKCYSVDSDGTFRLRNQASLEKAFERRH
jgi:hypothetical protein